MAKDKIAACEDYAKISAYLNGGEAVLLRYQWGGECVVFTNSRIIFIANNDVLIVNYSGIESILMTRRRKNAKLTINAGRTEIAFKVPVDVDFAKISSIISSVGGNTFCAHLLIK